jgi:pimeloyl-ACP methyl ester carboxylesterase
MPYAAVNDVRMYYQEEGHGEPLVLLLGALGVVDPAAPSGWGALLPDLTARYHTFSVEHRGHGRTNNPAARLSYARMAEDVAAFIERLEIAPAHVAGFSDGATVGLAIGMTRPELVRSLVCVGANYCLDDHVREALAFFDPAALERDHPQFAQMFAARHDPHHKPGYWRELVRQVRANVETELVWTEGDLRRIPVPTLVIAGEADLWDVGLTQTLAMQRSIPRAEMLILNHAGMDGWANHRVHFTRPEVVGPVMLDFLTRHAGPAVEARSAGELAATLAS